MKLFRLSDAYGNDACGKKHSAFKNLAFGADIVYDIAVAMHTVTAVYGPRYSPRYSFNYYIKVD